MRDQENSDPNPPFLVIVRSSFLPMLIVVLNSLLLWVFIGGILGPFTFPALIFNGLFVLFILVIYKKKTSNKGKMDTSSLENDDSNSLSYILKSSLLSVWVPCVVGSDQTPYLFLYSSLSSLAAKLFILILVVILVAFSIIPYSNHSFLLCAHQSELEHFNESQICSFSNKNLSCFSFNSTAPIMHKIRYCSDDENLIRILLVLVTLLPSLLSFFAAYKLHQVRTFYNLFKRNQSLHKSLIRTLVRERNVDKLEGILRDRNKIKQLNEPNAATKTALHLALEQNLSNCILNLMVKSGGDPLMTDTNSESCLEIVSRKGHHEYLDILLKAEILNTSEEARCLIMKHWSSSQTTILQ